MRITTGIASIAALLTFAAGAAAAGTWEFVASMPTPKVKTFAVKYDGAIYMVGGTPWYGGDQDGTVYKYAGGAWSTAAPLVGMGPVVGQGGAVDALNHIIVFGGTTVPDGDIAEGRAYDPVTGTTFTVPNVGVSVPAVNFATAVDEQHRIYRLGGGPGASGFNSGSMERYSGLTNSWESLAYLPFTRASIFAAYDGNGHIWGFGGYTSFGTPRLHDTIKYTVSTNTWETVGSLFLPIPASSGQAVLGADGRIYVIGGLEGSYGFAASGKVYVLDLSVPDPVLAAGPVLNTPRYDFGAVLGSDGFIYVMGGYSASGAPLSSVERLDTNPTTALVGDLNGDGSVNGADIGLLLGAWGAATGDLNGDGITNGADLGILLGAWTG